MPSPQRVLPGFHSRFTTRSERTARAGEYLPWALPTPLIRQKRVSGVRRKRLFGTALRVIVLLASDITVLLVLHLALGEFRQAVLNVPGLGEAIMEIAPHGVFPRLEMMSAVLIGLIVFGNYRAGAKRYSARTLFGGACLGLALIAWTQLWADFAVLRAIGVSVAILGLTLALVVERKLVDVLVERYPPQRRVVSRAIVIGSEEGSLKVKSMYEGGNDPELEVVGFLDTSPLVSRLALGGISDLVWLVEKHRINTIFFADISDSELMADLLEVADDLGCTSLAGMHTFPMHGFIPSVVNLRGIRALRFRRPSLVPHQLFAKRIFDLAAASLLLVVTLPVFAIVAVAIKLDSSGPVFFRARRIGFGGAEFWMYKFRSMVINADERRTALKSASLYQDGRLFKVPGDPRITSVGRFLRKSSLDELPQLWNVLRGEMSLVGPRPPLPDEVARYEEFHYDRFGMKPGITGPWQVGGRNSIRDFETVIRMETEYIQSWNIGKDIDIILRTVPAVMSMSGV